MTQVVAIGTSSFAEEDKSPLDLLVRSGAEVRLNPVGRRLTEDEAIRHFQGAHGVLAGLEPWTRRVLAATRPTLRAIVRVGTGMSNVDQAAASDLGVLVSNTPDAPTEAVAEMTVGALLTIARRLGPANEAMHRREWRKSNGFGLAGSTVLLIGFGRIGRRVAQLLHAFHANVLVTDPALSAMPETFAYCRLVDLKAGLATADVISLHASGEAVLLGATELSAVKPGAVLLNGARGGLVNEAAFVAALQEGRLSAAWVDTFSVEPYYGPLCDLPQVLLTPHLATYTRQCRRDMELDAVKLLLRYLDGDTSP